MPVIVQDFGQHNEISIDSETLVTSDATICLRGNGNRIFLAPGVSLQQGSITFGNGCSLRVGVGCRLAAIEIMGDREAHVVIGPNTEFTWSSRLYLHEPGHITIGGDCLIASGTLFTISDMHSILDLETGMRLNPPGDIALADKVWLAHEATVLKGSTIGLNCVIGYRSIISGTVPPNSLAVGAPARVVRSGIVWDKRLI